MKRTQKCRLILLFFITALMIAISVQAVCYAEETTGSESAVITDETEIEVSLYDKWLAYIKEKIVPVGVLALSAISGLYIAFAPLLAKIKSASERFKKATEEVEKATVGADTAIGKVAENVKLTEESKQKIKEFKAETDKKVKEVEAEFQRLQAKFMATQSSLDKILTILELGFGNIDELVKKGYAKEILKVKEVKSNETQKL